MIDVEARHAVPVTRAGDQIQCYDAGFFSRMVSWFTRDDKEPTPSHSATALTGGDIIEARREVRKVSFDWLVDKYARVEVWRHPMYRKDLKRLELTKLAAEGLLGKKYSYYRIWRQGLDSVFDTNWWTRSLGQGDSYICSQVSYLLHSRGNVRVAGVSLESVTPDDITDYMGREDNPWALYEVFGEGVNFTNQREDV